MYPEKTLLIVYHSQSGRTERLAAAVERGARLASGVSVKRMDALSAGVDDLEHCRCLVICSPEYFGYMAGAVKDLFDRTYEALKDRVIGKAYAVVISAGNDGTGALSSVERIVRGYKLKRAQEPIIVVGEPSASDETKCVELGQILAEGMGLGIY